MTQYRPDVAGHEAAVVAGHPLAAAAGARVLQSGGNAVDAAITMAAVLTVARPHMCGLGGDAFLLIHEPRARKVHALNGSGGAGSQATPEWYSSRGHDAIPLYGAESVSVPGAVRAWSDALERFGSIELHQALAPAIRYAEDGLPVSNRLSLDIQEERERLSADEELARVFLSGGHAPAAGSILRQPDLAKSLRTVARGGADEFYSGSLGQRISKWLEREGATITPADLSSHESEWTDPLRIAHHGHAILAFPPNSQGIALLHQLAILDQMDVEPWEVNGASSVVAAISACRAAFEDRDRFVADPRQAEVPVARLLSAEHARDLAERASELMRGERESHAGPTSATTARARQANGDTVYLCCVDRDGMGVSMIQSIFHSFGSGRMIPGTGIIPHNRGALFSLDRSHPNVVAPGKRPYHTLAPSMVLGPDDSLRMVLGTPGGDAQTQTVAQVLVNMLRGRLSPQAAIEAPRWRWYGGTSGTQGGVVAMEDGMPEHAFRAAKDSGLDVIRRPYGAEFGGAQAICIDMHTGVRWLGADPRREAYGIAW